MKVAIITFNRAISYGAVLQSLALKNTILSLGHECKVLNYKCDAIEKGASPFFINSLSVKDLLIFIFQIRMRLCKNKKFKIFAKKYLDTDSIKLNSGNIAENTKEFDVYITGSDQVWNYEITGLDENYFLTFAPKNKCRVSYAASFGVSNIPESLKKRYGELLNNMDHISVREQEGRKIVKELTGKDSVQCIDPVFLMNKEQWHKYLDHKSDFKDYILVYSIYKTECYDVAKKLSEQLNIPIVGLQTPMSNRTKCKRVKTESPSEFLGWFYHAEYIVTDSFHGTAFSVIFNKQFVVCTEGTMKQRLSRQRNLLNMLHLENRICTLEDYQKIFDPIDYESVENFLSESKNFSINYLKRVLEDKC